ncbi:MAG: class I SAM-dependent methyltransferase [Bacteroidales bacterium]|nr:class I SAM-dependent methyltransferase [Bacteroidales bacterium]
MQTLPPEKDALGLAAMSYFRTGEKSPIRIHSDIAADDVILPEYLFRSKDQMPELEKLALEHCRGKVLDVGAGVGCHSLPLQEAGIEVTALEISEQCCNIMNERGIKKIINQDFYEYSGVQFDVILMLMNGIGIAGDLEGLESFFRQLSDLLAPGGYAIFDSSDLTFLYEEEDEPCWESLNKNYYGEMQYQMCFRKVCGDYFKWLFIDFGTLESLSEKNGFEAILLAEGEHYDYLGMLRKKS